MKNALNLWRSSMSDWSPIVELQREVDRLFENFIEPSAPGSSARSSSSFMPACDVEDKGSHFLMSFDLPGVKKDDIQIELHDNQLVVSGTRKSESKKEEGGSRWVERSYGEFRRAFTLPSTVDPNQVEAHYEDGVLTLAIPKARAERSQQIKIGETKGGVLSKLLGQDKQDKKSA